MLEITVNEVMISPVETIGPADSARSAATKLITEAVGSLVVCEQDTPVGIITEYDISQLVSAGDDPDATTVETAMTEQIVTIAASDRIETAAKRLREHGIKQLPVLDASGKITGIVTTTNLSNYLPHLVQMGRDEQQKEEQKHHRVRSDTAYENDEWDYEYIGNERGIDVGDTIRFSKTLAAEDVERFAEISGDTNRLHLDREYAEATRFGERIAHGTLVSGLVSAALARLPGLIIYISQNVSFLGPVRLDSRVTAECEVIEQIGENRFRLATKVMNPDDETVIDGEAVVVADEIPIE